MLRRSLRSPKARELLVLAEREKGSHTQMHPCALLRHWKEHSLPSRGLRFHSQHVYLSGGLHHLSPQYQGMQHLLLAPKGICMHKHTHKITQNKKTANKQTKIKQVKSPDNLGTPISDGTLMRSWVPHPSIATYPQIGNHGAIYSLSSTLPNQSQSCC